jgi:ABC-type Mn2+/Zn2+ transport system ATPase subunit
MERHMNDTLITLHDLTIGYDGQPVIAGISLTIAGNSFTAILGVNGSGKSTLLKTLLGLIPPIAGRIETTGPAGAPIVYGYVPQTNEHDPIYLLTAFDVALMGTFGRVRPGRFVPSSERAFTMQCLQAAGADEFARKRFAELSGGQKQRVLIARALATRPDVLVLDEPTAGVDAAATFSVLEFISRTRKERQITVLLVTHDFSAIRRHARQVIWLHQGKVLQGSPDELLSADRMAQIFEIGTG